MGNVLDTSFPGSCFKTVWKKLFLNSKSTCNECSLCWLRNICRNCLGKRYTSKGTIYETMKDDCELRKKVVEDIIKLIAKQSSQR
jgi:sulfatase maturation enzyme AslB (radical SAM superfamily)